METLRSSRNGKRRRSASGRAAGRKARLVGLAGSRPRRPPRRPSATTAHPLIALFHGKVAEGGSVSLGLPPARSGKNEWTIDGHLGKSVAHLSPDPFRRFADAKPRGAAPNPGPPMDAKRGWGMLVGARSGRRTRHFAASGRGGASLGPERRASPREASGRFRGLRPARIRSAVRPDSSLRPVLPAVLALRPLRAPG